MNVSVIVPVFDQPEPLQRCLAALARQTYPSADFEVVVVDNGSEIPVTEPHLAAPRVRLVREGVRGSYRARNAGLAAARGEILAFTDADCVPATDWIERGVAALSELGAEGMLAGRIECTAKDPEHPTAVELYELVLGFQQRVYLETMGFSATANMFTTRRTFDRVGAFDGDLASGGDFDWGQRVRDVGLSQIYREDVRVVHPARRSLRALCRKHRRIAGGHQVMARRRNRVAHSLIVQTAREVFPFGKLAEHWPDERLRGAPRKLTFAALMVAVGVVRSLERLRVQAGGLPRTS